MARKVLKSNGKNVCFSMDPDAEQLLRAMVPWRTGIGLLLSELIRQEAQRRANRPALLQALREDALARGAIRSRGDVAVVGVAEE
jgi:hypothetical protein